MGGGTETTLKAMSYSELPSQRRAIAMDLTVLNRYFDLLEDTIKGNDLHNRPALFFNCDEI